MLQLFDMRYLLSLILFSFIFNSFANKTAAEIYVDLQKMHSLKRVLYIAAHPDDENTRALAWFSLGEKAETAYLSLTRGDGGQNLIGNELSEDLGALRTQELLAARSIDRANQYFTRAVDFGYSKSATETFEKWGKDVVLSDVVLVIRQFKPDVIITRFPPDKRAGHGHHTASAMLAIEAFEKASDPNFLPEQVAQHGVWNTTSIYWNTSVWWDDQLADKAEKSNHYLSGDIGGYNSLLGMSYNEIGTLARSQHKCQGFGAIVERGARTEYFEHLGGQKLENSFFEKNKMSWGKLVNPAFEVTFNNLLKNFDFVSPEKNIDVLLSLRQALASIPTKTLAAIKAEKLTLLDEIIRNCLGLYLEVVTNDYAYSKGDSINFNFNLLNRSSVDVKLTGLNGQKFSSSLPSNTLITKKIGIINSKNKSNLYWLNQPFSTLFSVEDPINLGKAEGDATYISKIGLTINDIPVNMQIPVTHKWRDPSYGERRRTIISTPDFTVNFDQKSAILKEGNEKTIQLKVHSFKENLKNEIQIETPEGWEISPKIISINTESKHEESYFDLTLKPTVGSKRGHLKLTDSEGKELYSLTEITYDHIPSQTIFKPAALVCVSLDAKIIPGKIAYIKGAGDDVPQAIEQLGFNVTLLEVTDLPNVDLSTYQSVVLGIRIYNVHPELKNFENKLSSYVSNGGNLIMQYNTSTRSANGSKFSPLSFDLSRSRVTDENSTVTFLAPEHPLMNSPNKITQTDFNDWVQERGLYFASNWQDGYTPIFAWNDKGEEPQKGALIVAKHGKGQFIYTGISFFRELPNGVEGAYRLFANLLSYKK